jgi:hypothetical protein
MPRLVQIVELTNNRFTVIRHYTDVTLTQEIDGPAFDRLIPSLTQAGIPLEYPDPLTV